MVKKIIKKLFFSKLSRKREAEFLKKHSSDLKTLEIGAKSKENCKYFPNLTTLNIEVVNGVDIMANAEDLGGIIKDESFDRVLCISVLEHTKQPIKIVENIRKILKKDGLVIVSVPFIMSLHDTPQDYWRFTRYGLIELFKDFQLVEIKDSTTSLEAIGYLYHRLFLQSESFTKIVNLFYFISSKITYFFAKFLKRKEFGHYFTYKKRHQEENIMAVNILAIFKK